MKGATKTKSARKPKRDLFGDLSEGMTALAEARAGKRTLRTPAVQFKPAPSVSATELLRVRRDLKLRRSK